MLEDNEKTFKLMRGDVVTIERDMGDVNLLLCKIFDKNNNKYIKFFVSKEDISIYESESNNSYEEYYNHLKFENDDIFSTI